MTFPNLSTLLIERLRVLYAGEHQAAKALPKLLDGVASHELKSLLERSLKEAEGHIDTLEAVSAELQEKLSGQRCRVIEQLLKEAVDLTERRGDERVIDVGILGILRAISAHQRTSYEVARDIAQVLEQQPVLPLIEQSLLDHNRSEQSWTVLCEDMLDSIHAATKPHPGGEGASRAAAG